MTAKFTTSMLRDASLIVTVLMALLFSMGMLGVPLLSASFGLNEAGTWQSVSLALLILAASGYLLVLVLMDLFSADAYKRDALLATDYKQRWKPLVLVLAVLVVSGGLVYSKMTRGYGGTPY